MRPHLKRKAAQDRRRWKDVPETLYKYYAPPRIEVFSSFRVRFSQLAALNDPFEFLVDMEAGVLRESAMRAVRGVVNPLGFATMAVQQALELLGTGEKAAKAPLAVRILVGAMMLPLAPTIALLAYPFVGKFMKRLMAGVGDELERLLGKARDGLFLIFSCSETWDSVPMWALYAANHTGFAIGIDPRTAFLRTDRKGTSQYINPRKVVYRDEIPSIRTGSMDIDSIITAKMSHWSYEREWRFIEMPDDAADRVTIDGGCDILLFEINPESIREIIFAAECTVETAREISSKLSKAGMTPQYFVVKRGPRYGFERIRISDPAEMVDQRAAPNGPLPSMKDIDFSHMMETFTDMHKAAESHWLLGRLGRLGMRRNHE